MREMILKGLLLAVLFAMPPAVFLVRDARRSAPEESSATVAAEVGTRLGDRTPEEAAILEVVHGLMNVMTSRDTARLAALMAPEGRFVRIDVEPGSAEPLRVTSRSDFARSLAGGEAHFLERVWDARVLVDGPMASVWAPYDFHVDTEFSHCGVDVFELVRSEEGWRIISVTYTRHPPATCSESPLGAP